MLFSEFLLTTDEILSLNHQSLRTARAESDTATAATTTIE